MKIRNKRVLYTIIVTLIVVFSTTFAILMTLERTDYRNYLQAEYSKNMYELINSVQNIRVNLGKSAIVGSREQSIIVFGDIFRNAAIANDKLHSLPIEQQTIQNTSKFLSQVGDFCYSLGKAASQGKELEEKDYNTIELLKNKSFQLEASLNEVANDINSGRVKWGEIRKKVSGVLAKNGEETIVEKFSSIQKQVAQYPALIYDGPFSDNVQDIKPRISSEREVSKEEAQGVAEKAIGKNRIENITLKEEQTRAKIPTYSFDIILKGRDEKSKVVCDISKKGGKVVYVLDYRQVKTASISKEKAMELGRNYLQGLGYDNMYPTYALNYNNTLIVNYVYKQGDIIVYPDQIKVKMALDDGKIIGVEAEKYLISHLEKRNIENPKITQEVAKQRVGKKLNVKSVNLTIVPTEVNTEALCYEFLGAYNGESFIVYINANTGFEQRIIQIINTPNGELTM
ncbi:germination protein YpeB [Clostridium sp. HMP27]|uniref:germination protein YpeB n=1 Tax=Clostridium sp. HMP27 TaxID=1487921 RepID=UPI00052C81F4|nr:germination protein YpeB [Clostridium sp. HMP27]KGK90685.1 spore gernimation protein [Clostridium sp. HMP27]